MSAKREDTHCVYYFACLVSFGVRLKGDDMSPDGSYRAHMSRVDDEVVNIADIRLVPVRTTRVGLILTTGSWSRMILREDRPIVSIDEAPMALT